MKNSSGISQVVIPSLNLIPQKKLALRQNSQTITKVKSLCNKNDFQITTIQLDQTAKPISFRQNNHNKQDLTKSVNFLSTNHTPKGQDKSEIQRQQQGQFSKHPQEQRQYSSDQPNFAIIDLSNNIINGKVFPIKSRDSLPKQQQQQQQNNLSNQNFFRLRQTPNWFCQKTNTQPKSEKLIEKKEYFSKKITEASTPQCRGNSNDRNNQPNFTRLDYLTKQINQDNQQNPFNFNYLNSNNNQVQIVPNNMNNNSKATTIFSNYPTSRQNYFQLNQKKNELLKTKIAMNQQQECLQQKFLDTKQRNFNKVNNIYENDFEIPKKKKQEDQQKPFNKQQQFQHQNQQLQQYSSIRQISLNNERNDSKQQPKQFQKLQATSLSPNRFEAPAQHLKRDGDETKGKIQNNNSNQYKPYQLQRQCSHQQINSMTNHTIIQAIQRAKYFDSRGQSKDNSKMLKPAKTLDPDQLMTISNIFEEDEPLYSSGNGNLISPLIKQSYQQFSPKLNQIGSSQQSYDQIKIWQSSEKSIDHYGSDQDNLNNIKPIIRQSKQTEEDKRDEFIQLYVKRFKNYPQVSPTSKSMNDFEIKSLVMDIFYNQSRNSYHASPEEDRNKQLTQYATTASGKTNLSTPKNQKQTKGNQNISTCNIPYQVAMMPINSPSSNNSAQGVLSHDSTPIQKINTIFASDDKQKREKYHKEFIKCFFQETKNRI